MGLDMFLYIKNGKEYEELCHWRKANAIHNWFKENVGECDNEFVDVNKEQLQKLVDVCIEVKEILDSRTKFYDLANQEYYSFDEKTCEEIIELLPPLGGFFFGTTDIDKYYYDDISDTIEKLGEVIQNVDFDKDRIQYYSWW